MKTIINSCIATRYHDFCMGHRVVGHEGKCRHLHGHNYRITFAVRPKVSDLSLPNSERSGKMALDHVGRVLDFSVIKSTLCNWIEEHWDHKFMAWNEDALINAMCTATPELYCDEEQREQFLDSLVFVHFNPTAENIAQYFIEIGNELLQEHHCELAWVELSETRKCGVRVETSNQ